MEGRRYLFFPVESSQCLCIEFVASSEIELKNFASTFRGGFSLVVDITRRRFSLNGFDWFPYGLGTLYPLPSSN